MHPDPQAAAAELLAHLVHEFGEVTQRDSATIAALLGDRAGEEAARLRPQLHALTRAVDAGIPNALRQGIDPARLAEAVERAGAGRTHAEWAVQAWGQALGLPTVPPTVDHPATASIPARVGAPTATSPAPRPRPAWVRPVVACSAGAVALVAALAKIGSLSSGDGSGDGKLPNRPDPPAVGPDSSELRETFDSPVLLVYAQQVLKDRRATCQPGRDPFGIATEYVACSADGGYGAVFRLVGTNADLSEVRRRAGARELAATGTVSQPARHPDNAEGVCLQYYGAESSAPVIYVDRALDRTGVVLTGLPDQNLSELATEFGLVPRE